MRRLAAAALFLASVLVSAGCAGPAARTEPIEGRPTDGQQTGAPPTDGQAADTRPTDGEATVAPPTEGPPTHGQPGKRLGHPSPGTAALDAVPVDLPFEAVVPAGLGIRWVTIFDPADEVALVTADAGKSRWSRVATGCELTLAQARIDPAEAPDDRSASDAALATWLGVPSSDVTMSAVDAPLPLGEDGGAFDARAVLSTLESGRRELAQARVFRELGTALVLSVRCPAAQDVVAEATWFRAGHVLAQLAAT